MMFKLALFCLLIAATLALPDYPKDRERETSEQQCILCEWLVAYTDAYKHDNTEMETKENIGELCNELETPLKAECLHFLKKNFQSIYRLLNDKKTQDEICGVHGLHLCLPTESHFAVTSSPFLAIPQGQDPVRDTIVIEEAYSAIQSVDVSFFIEHNSAKDLIVVLTHQNVSVKLIATPDCSPSGNYIVTLSEDAFTSIQDVCQSEEARKRHLEILPIEGVYSPYQSLSVFKGMEVQGEWTLSIQDIDNNEFIGDLNTWSLDFWGVELKSELTASPKTTTFSGSLSLSPKQYGELIITPRDKFSNPLTNAQVSISLQAECGIGIDLPPLQLPQAVCSKSGANFQCSDNVKLLSWRPHNSMGGSKGNDMWGWTDPQTGKEYALVGQTTQTTILDITDPEAPIWVAYIPRAPGTSSSSWRDLKTYKDHVFIVSEASRSGVQVADLRRLRNLPPTLPMQMTAEVHFTNGGKLGNSHNIFINQDTGYAYVVGATSASCGGMYIIDVNEPLSPKFVTCHSPRYTHDIECVIYKGPDTRYQGEEICFCSDGGYGFTIKVVTDKQNIKTISRFDYSGRSYCHQSWLSADQKIAFMNDELGPTGRTYVVNVEDLENPKCQFSGCYYDHAKDNANSAQHNNYLIANDVAVQSNYRSGVRIMDMSDPSNPDEVAFLDTAKNYNPSSSGFNGQWSNYPFFSSGTIGANDIEEGFFAFSVSLSDLRLVLSQNRVDLCGKESVEEITISTRYYGEEELEEINIEFENLPDFIVAEMLDRPDDMVLRLQAGEDALAGSYVFVVKAKAGEEMAEKRVVVNVFDHAPTLNYEVMQMEDGKYRVKYEIDEAGVYPLHVKMNGEEIGEGGIYVDVEGESGDAPIFDFFRRYQYDVTWRYMIFGFCFMMLALFFAVLMRAVRKQRVARQSVKSQV